MYSMNITAMSATVQANKIASDISRNLVLAKKRRKRNKLTLVFSHRS
jgi:hypothetical protein